MRGYAKAGIPERIREAGGEIYAVTSEPRSLAARAQQEWAFDFDAVGDPHQEIVETCRKRGWLDLYVNTKLRFLAASASQLGWTPQHPKGYLQPGILALAADGRVLYRWRGVPTRKNNGGATQRPTAEHVWSSVARALECAGADAPLDEDPPLDTPGIPWPIFVSLLLANGWFVRPLGFAHREDLPTPVRLRRAVLRLVGFVGAWTAAFAWLPTLPVAAALAAWVIWIAPKVRLVNDEFQDVSAG